MPIKFKPVLRTNPLKKDEPNKYYPGAISTGKIELKELAKRISRKSTTVSDIDTHAVLMALTQEIAASVQAGETVHLGDLGYFHITLSGEGVADAKNLTSAHIKEARLRFVPGKEIDASLKTATFEKE
jgi:predicted histone-like DNA-binding protein